MDNQTLEHYARSSFGRVHIQAQAAIDAKYDQQPPRWYERRDLWENDHAPRRPTENDAIDLLRGQNQQDKEYYRVEGVTGIYDVNRLVALYLRALEPNQIERQLPLAI